MTVLDNYSPGSNRARPPGVRFEEIAPSKAVALRTGVPVFVGFVEKGTATANDPDQDCRLVRPAWSPSACRAVWLTSWADFPRCIGRAVHDGFLDYAVRGFFENGGEICAVLALWEVNGTHARANVLRSLFEGRGASGSQSSLGDFFEDLENVDLVCVPDLMREGIRSSPDLIVELTQLILNYCTRMSDRFAIFGVASVTGTSAGETERASGQDRGALIQDVSEGQQALPYTSLRQAGARYFPWLQVKPLMRHVEQTRVLVPPCGHVAGVYARTDAEVGAHKAPANALLEGVVDLDAELTDDEQARLNDLGVNCLRSFPGRGIRVWGARTLSAQPTWRYVNVRRLFLTLVRWIEANSNDLIFEPNAPDLWERVRRRLSSHCYDLYRGGALKGRTPDEAFFVKCDAETNTLDVRAQGQVITEIGLAPAIPAEFLVVRITQSAAGTTVTLPAGT